MDKAPGRAIGSSMGDKQIQTINNRDYALARSRPRSLVGQISLVLLEPGAFFRALPFAANSRQWVWAALLILALVGISAVRQEALLNGDTGAAPVDTGAFPGGNVSGGGGGPVPIGPGVVAVQPGGFPGGGGEAPPIPPTDTSAAAPDVSATWTTALLAASGVILGWAILAVLLCEVSLFNGVAPSLGHNVQIAIWTSVPFGLMAALQLLYYAAGGTVGEPGISGLLTQWEGYAALPTFTRSLLLSLTSRLTLFWLWSLVLIYIGGRMALQGKAWAVLIVVVVWVVIVVVVPVLTGAVAAPEEAPLTDFSGEMPGEFFAPDNPLGEGILPDRLGGEADGPPWGEFTPEPFGLLPDTTPDATETMELLPLLTPEVTPEGTPPSEP
ncbi:MAG: hypothetical protein HZC41_05135 [Chloroflexi bacterium]|nr:hypothetical protein [Chloroflexota bacterium]